MEERDGGSVNDLKPHRHGDEGDNSTHWACPEAIKKNLPCCGCSGHRCKEKIMNLEELLGQIEKRAERANNRSFFDNSEFLKHARQDVPRLVEALKKAIEYIDDIQRDEFNSNFSDSGIGQEISRILEGGNG